LGLPAFVEFMGKRASKFRAYCAIIGLPAHQPVDQQKADIADL